MCRRVGMRNRYTNPPVPNYSQMHMEYINRDMALCSIIRNKRKPLDELALFKLLSIVVLLLQ